MSLPDSISLFAGFLSASISVEAAARGIVDISRLWSRPSLERIAEGGGADWEIEVESQDSPDGIDGTRVADIDVEEVG